MKLTRVKLNIQNGRVIRLICDKGVWGVAASDNPVPASLYPIVHALLQTLNTPDADVVQYRSQAAD